MSALHGFLFYFVILFRSSFVYFFSNKNNSELSHLLIKYNSIEEIVSFISSLAIFSYSFHILSKKEKLFSKILSFDNLKWIYAFFKFGFLTYVFWIISLIITIALDFKKIIYTYFPLRILTTILIYWLGYQAIIQLRLLKERKNLRRQLNFQKNRNSKQEIIEEKDTDKKILFDKLNTILKKQKLFTEPKLNVDFLANEIDISSSKLSNIIKQYTDKNFSDFINEHRIGLAKNLLKHKDYKNYTITSIGLESGFNSKSAFYYTFKKHTGITPTAYQKL